MSVKREDGSGGFIDLLWTDILLVEHPRELQAQFTATKVI